MSDFEEPFGATVEQPDEPVSSTPAPRPRPHSRSPRHRRRTRPSFFWPILLIGGGAMMLLSELGYVPWESWAVAWRLWPLLLIALGFDLLIGRRSLVGAFASSLLILVIIGVIVVLVFFAQSIPRLADWIVPAEVRFEHVEYALGDAERAEVLLDWSSAPGYLSALDQSDNLIEGEIAYLGELVFDTETMNDTAVVELDSHVTDSLFQPPNMGRRDDYRWDVMLSPEIPLDLTLDASSGLCDFDLTGLQLERLALDVGSGAIDLTLPQGESYRVDIDGGSGSLEMDIPDATSLEMVIDGGSGSITIALPDDVAARITLQHGSGHFSHDGRFQLVEGETDGDGVWETEDFDTAEHTIILTVDQGSGSIRIQ